MPKPTPLSGYPEFLPAERAVERELTLVDELEDHRRRKRLGERREVVFGLRRRGDVALDIRHPKTLRPNNVGTARDRRRERGDAECRSELIEM